MSIYNSSRLAAHKREREEEKYSIGSSGTSATARVRDARRDAYLSEMGQTTSTPVGGSIGRSASTTPTAGSVGSSTSVGGYQAPKTTESKGSGYTPTYGSGALYTSAGSTASSGSDRTTYRNRTSGYTPTYGPGALYTSAGSTASGGSDRTTYRNRTSGYTPTYGPGALYSSTDNIAGKRFLGGSNSAGIPNRNVDYFNNASSGDAYTSVVWNDYARKQAVEQEKEFFKNNPGALLYAIRQSAPVSDTVKALEEKPWQDMLQRDLKKMEGNKPSRPWYNTAFDMVNHAAGITATGMTGFLDGVANVIPAVEGWIMNEENPDATFTGQLLKPITDLTGALNDIMVKDTETSAKRWREDFADKSPAAKMATEFGVTAMAALPYMLTLYLTQGSSVGQSLVTNTAGAPVLNGAGNVALTEMSRNAMMQMAAKPTWKFSFAQQYGNTYNSAKAGGATELEANLAASIAGYMNATIEHGGGIEQLPEAMKRIDPGDPKAILQWLRTPVAEGAENVAQGVTSNVAQKGVYADEKPWFSAKDPNAVFSGARGSEEFATGAAINGLYTAPAALFRGMSSATVGKQLDADAGDSPNTEVPPNHKGRAVGENGQTEASAADLLQKALAMPEDTKAHQAAAELSGQLEQSLTELGLDASELYHMSHGEQLKLIDQTAESVLTDQAVGELAELVQAEHPEDSRIPSATESDMLSGAEIHSGVVEFDTNDFHVNQRQFGHKVRRHAKDFGLDPASENDRTKLYDIVVDIVENATERRIGDWRGQEEDVIFHIKEDDVVITRQDGDFVTVLKGGINNARVKNARK